MKRVLIIDGTNAFYRSYIVNPTIAKNGQPIGGVIGFLKSLQKLIREIMPEQYKDPVVAYRSYYLGDKAHIAAWKQNKPAWWDK